MPAYTFNLNGAPVTVDAPGNLQVLWALRDKLGVTGPKYGCGIDVCKACTSHLDGKGFNPCVVNLEDIEGKDVLTIEGLADGDTLHPIQQAWLEQDVAQCGYCQPGQIMAALLLLNRTTEPTDAEIDAIDNVCRCGTYFRVRTAIKRAGELMREQAAAPPPAEQPAQPPTAVDPTAAPTGAAPAATAAPTLAAAAGGSTTAVSGGTLPRTGASTNAAVAAAGLVAAAAAATRAARGSSDEEGDAATD